MNSGSDLQRRAFFLLLMVLMALGFWVLFPFFNTILLAIVLSVVFYPLHRRFLKWTHSRKGLSATCSVLSVLILLIIPIGILLTLLTAQLANIVQHFQHIMPGSEMSGILAQWHHYLDPLIQKFETLIGTQINLMDWGVTAVKQIGQYVAQYSPSVITETAGFFLNFFIMLIVLFYLFRDGDILFAKILRLSPVKDQYEIKLASEIQETIYGIFYGSFLTGAVQAVLATIGYYIAHVPGALVWGVITFFVSFIPILGTAVIIIPLVIYLLIQGHTGYAIFLAIYGVIAIGSVDNFLRPFLIRTSIHQAFLFLSLFGGMAVMGPMGILVGPIVMALLIGTLRIYERDFLGSAAEQDEPV